MSSDVIECEVARPPKTREEAIALDWEQYWYCGDIVDPGVGSAAALAATLFVATKKVSPKGRGSAIRIVQFYTNRTGKNLSVDRRRELEKAKGILQSSVGR